ncbi:hypothetical protein [Microcoleus sp. FACHB-672]|uniref:hypothetical protein n=1 Tax=Microcoleus sp. FACHB-672 TaxID=2692825 RepID=UPI00168398BF|nr:hypothetical protein [Microcoleus sp. FACHB-672]MBD2042726.1 hypothetical protein [Microcoleus sp. FACHB-672]
MSSATDRQGCKSISSWGKRQFLIEPAVKQLDSAAASASNFIDPLKAIYYGL